MSSTGIDGEETTIAETLHDGSVLAKAVLGTEGEAESSVAAQDSDTINYN